MNTNTIALDALKAAYITMQHMGNVLNNMDAVDEDEDAEHDAAFEAVRAAIAALEAEPQDGDVEQALNRMDALLDPSLNLLAVSENSITLQGCRADMLTIRRALRMAPAAREGWQPIETAPKDGTEILMTNGVDVSSGSWYGGDNGTYDLDGASNCDEREAGWMDWSGGMQPDPTRWMPLPAAQAGAAQEPKP